jgi:hypothetical protein
MQLRRRRAPEYMCPAGIIHQTSFRAVSAYNAADLAAPHRFAALMAETNKKRSA